METSDSWRKNLELYVFICICCPFRRQKAANIIAQNYELWRSGLFSIKDENIISLFSTLAEVKEKDEKDMNLHLWKGKNCKE